MVKDNMRFVGTVFPVMLFLSVCLCRAAASESAEIYYINNGRIHKINSDGSGHVLVEQRKLSRKECKWSPDKNFIVYHLLEQKKEVLYLRDIERGLVYRLFAFDGAPDNIVWSADSRLVAIGGSLILSEEPDEVVIVDVRGQRVGEIRESIDSTKTSWQNLWWNKTNDALLVEATYVGNPYNLNKRFISIDIATGKETLLAEAEDAYNNEDETARKFNQVFKDRYEWSGRKAFPSAISESQGNVYFSGRKITDFNELCYSGMNQGFNYVDILPDGKILIEGPPPLALRFPFSRWPGLFYTINAWFGQELEHGYIFDPWENKLKSLFSGSQSVVRKVTTSR